MQGLDPRDFQTIEQSLDWAIHEATTQHAKQLDKAGMPYILHPLRVMMAMETIEEKIVAVLHDVMEDGYLSRDMVRDFCNRKIADAVVALTHKKGESYDDYILRVKENNLARRVKIADLCDNLNRDRIPNPTDVDIRRWEKYEKALITLGV